MAKSETDTQTTLSSLSETASGSPDPAVGQVYGDRRHAVESDGETTYPEQYVIVFVDDHRVLLKNLDETDYRYETREWFVEAAGSRFPLLREGAAGSAHGAHAPHDLAGVLEALRWHRDRFQESGAAEHSQRIDDALSTLEVLAPTEMEWTNVPNVGEKTAENLVSEGIETDIDLWLTPDVHLLDIRGVGEGTLANLREHAGPAADD